MKIAVAGGTGLVGRFLVKAAKSQVYEVVVLIRTCGLDPTSGEGLTDSLDRVNAVIDVTNRALMSPRPAQKFFATVTENLQRAELDTEVERHVALSIVGIDKIDAGYYSGKLEQERITEGGKVP